jgi:hypothetical protein
LRVECEPASGEVEGALLRATVRFRRAAVGFAAYSSKAVGAVL